ncbi:MAG: DUF4224 domain-containing protein [Burkholderia sp.]
MSTGLMTHADLVQVTGMKRHSKQAEWFKREFGVDVPRRDDHSISLMWETYQALNAKKVGLAPAAPGRGERVELCYD